MRLPNVAGPGPYKHLPRINRMEESAPELAASLLAAVDDRYLTLDLGAGSLTNRLYKRWIHYRLLLQVDSFLTF